MPPVIKKMGKVGAPQFGSLTKASPVKKRNIPAILAIVLAGVAVILYLKSRSNSTVSTGPAVSINGGSAPDQSTIDNLTASVLALQGLQPGNTTTPGGGTSTPQTTVTTQTNPGSGTPNPTPAFLGPPNTTDTTKPVNTTGTTKGYQAAINKVLSYGGNIQTVGPLTYPSGITTAQKTAADASNLSLVDWYKYQYAKVASAQNGVIVGESAAFLQTNPSASAYLQNTLQGGNLSFYGPNAGAEQKAADAAASAQAKLQLGIK